MRAHTKIFLNSSKNLHTIRNIDIDLLSKSFWDLIFQKDFKNILYEDLQKNFWPFGLFTRIFFKTKNENKSQKIFQRSQKGFGRNFMKIFYRKLNQIFWRFLEETISLQNFQKIFWRKSAKQNTYIVLFD